MLAKRISIRFILSFSINVSDTSFCRFKVVMFTEKNTWRKFSLKSKPFSGTWVMSSEKRSLSNSSLVNPFILTLFHFPILLFFSFVKASSRISNQYR